MLLVEGRPGMGKSSLLAQAARDAAARGFELTEGTADESGQAVPFAPLRMALHGRPGSRGRQRRDAGAAGAAVRWVPEVGRIRGFLAELAVRNPVLVSLDDLQWADQATLMALRTMPWALGGHRLLWVLARSAVPAGNRAELLFRLLEDDGAVRVTLAPLTADEVTSLLTDGFGAPPDESLLALAADAGGNPELLSQLVQGLREENAVRTEAGRACLVRLEPPRRIQEAARQRLAGLGGQAQQFVEITAVLGGSLGLEDAAALTAEAPAVALARVDEALDAGILEATAETLEFRYELVRQAIAASIPAPVRRALHRQYGEMLLDRGGSATEGAAHLLEGARPGDHTVLARLDQAAELIRAASPQTAADLAAAAVRLTDHGDARHFTRSVAAAEALAAAGRVTEAGEQIRAIPAQQLPPELAARLHCARSAVACLGGRAGTARAEAEKAQSPAGLPAWVRDEAVTAQLKALAALGHHRRARRPAHAVLAAPGRHGDDAAAGSLVTLAAAAWEDARLTESLDLLREAARRGARSWRDARRFQPQLIYAARLIDVGRLDEAATVIGAAADETEAPGSIPGQVIPAVLRARMNLALGLPDQAAAEAEAARGIASELGAEPYVSLAHCLLARVALRRGGLHDAGQHIASVTVPVPNCAQVFAPAEAALAGPGLAVERDGPEAAMAAVKAICADRRSCRWILVGDPAAGPWLVRTGVAAGAGEAASRVTRLARFIAAGNPATGAMATVAAHCEGILRGDLSLLAQAARDHPDAWARASAAEDLAVLLEATGSKREAVRWLTEALEAYARTGAIPDPARVRRRLRKLGARPRHWANGHRPASGWDSLTEAERTTTELVAQGLTNKQVAERMYVSANTVAFHLRHVFRKLSVASRGELTRLAMERANGMS